MSNIIEHQNIMNNDDLEFIPTLLPLRRTHKASCPYCSEMTCSYDSYNRSVPCVTCSTIIIQKITRGFLDRKKVRNIKKKKLVKYVFLTKDVKVPHISNLIHSFL